MMNDIQLSPPPIIISILACIGIIAFILIVILLIFNTYDFLKNKIYKNIYKKACENIDLKSEISKLKLKEKNSETVILKNCIKDFEEIIENYKKENRQLQMRLKKSNVFKLELKNEELEKIISRYRKIIKDEKLDRKYEKVEL